MKYSKSYERDFKWYLSMRNTFNFDGKPLPEVVYDRNSISGKEAFFLLDSQGKLLSTKHPNMFSALIKTKGSINLHIKMYAEDRASGVLPRMLFEDICAEYKAPDWFRAAVENQKRKYYNK